MDGKEEDNETNTEKQKGWLDQDGEESNQEMHPPAFKALELSFQLLCTNLCHSVFYPNNTELMQPALHEHRQKCIKQNEREAEEEENIDCYNAGRDCELGGGICGDGRVAELLRDVDEHVRCDISAPGLELRNGEDEEGGEEGS